MTKKDKIHIKIELWKDEKSNELSLMTYFDSNAPNFSKDEEGYYWMPTVEEKDFLNEAFELMPTQGSISPIPHKTVTEPPKEKEDLEPKLETDTEIKKEEDIEHKEQELEPTIEVSTPEPMPEPEIKEERKPWKLPSPFEKKTETEEKPVDMPPTEERSADMPPTEEKPVDVPPLEKKEEDGVFEETEEPKPTEGEDKNKEEEEGFLVEADEEAIDAALRKKEERDRSMVEADEDTIVEKVLSQKKKGKWSKGR